MELSFCNDHGLPHSIFLGRVWPNPSNPSEPYWMDEDYIRAMAFLDAQSEVCDRCGTREPDWTDDQGFPLDPPILEADTHRCFGCYQIELAQTTIPKDEKGVRPIIRKRSIHVPDYILKAMSPQ